MRRSSSSSPLPAPHPIPPSLSSFSSSLSSLTCCPELDLSVTLSPGSKASHIHMKPHPLKKSQQSNQSELKPHPRGQTGKKQKTQVCSEELVVVTVTPEPDIRPQRGSRRHHHVPRQWAVPPAEAFNQGPDCLEKVEPNTTLALKAELQSLQGLMFNSQKAIQETLQRSERTKNLINTRATEVVNVSRSQPLFTSLVSISVHKDELISQLLQDRLLQASTPCCHGNKAADSPLPLFFMTSDLLRQKPLPPEEAPVSINPRPLTHHVQSAFDLYRQQRRYEATP